MVVRTERSLILCCSLSLFLLTLIVLYLRYFPILFSAGISNAIFLTLLLFLVLIITLTILTVRRKRDSALVLLTLSVFAFVARAAPNLRMNYPPLNDPYYHFVSTRTLITEGVIDGSNVWYGMTSFQLHWPDMHILALGLNQVAGMDLWSLFRFLEPTFGVLFLLGMYMLTKSLTSREDIALLAAALATFGDVIIFFQSEYHPQGLALIYLVLMIVPFLRSREKRTTSYAFLFIIMIGAMTLSHHFTSLFVGVIALAFAASCLILPHLRWLDFGSKTLLGDVNSMLLVGVTSLSYHLLAYDGAIRQFARMIGLHLDVAIFQGTFALAGDFLSRPTAYVFFSYSKWILVFFALSFMLFYYFKMKHNPTIDRVILLLLLILAAGLAALTIPNAPLDRLLAFSLPLITPLVAILFITATELKPHSLRHGWRVAWTAITLLTTVMVISAGFLNAPNSSGVFFHEPEPNVTFWYSNQMPEMDQYKYLGTWTQDRLSSDPEVTANNDARVAIFYFGEKRDLRMIDGAERYGPSSYVLINPSVDYVPGDDRVKRYDHELNAIYSNGELRLYKVTG